MTDFPWNVLEIEPTQDEALIRRGYASRLKQCRPDENPQGFQQLREARDLALQLSARKAMQPATVPFIGAPAFQYKTTIVQAAPIVDDAAQAEAATLTRLVRELDELRQRRLWQMEDPEPGWTQDQWRDFIARAGDLGIIARQRLRVALASRLFPLLPGNPDAEQDGEFWSILETVSIIEGGFAFSDMQTDLMRFMPVSAVAAYGAWLRFVRQRDAMQERVKKGASAYKNADGGPGLPPEDRVAAYPSSYIEMDRKPQGIAPGWRYARGAFVPLLVYLVYKLCTVILSSGGASFAEWSNFASVVQIGSGVLTAIVLLAIVYFGYRVLPRRGQLSLISLIFPTLACLCFEQPRLAIGMALLSMALLAGAFEHSLLPSAILIAICAANAAARLGLLLMLPKYAMGRVVDKAMAADQMGLLRRRDRLQAIRYDPAKAWRTWSFFCDVVTIPAFIFILHTL